MLSLNHPRLRGKKLIVFDLDGTLTPSKYPADTEMIRLLLKLLQKKRVAVIGGGKYGQFKEQLLRRLPQRDLCLRNLSIFPTTSTAFYRFNHGWEKVYSLVLTKTERAEIMRAFKVVFKKMKYVHPKKTYGTIIENRGTQMSFSPLGQDVVTVLGKNGIRLKEEWKKKNNPLRLRLAKILQKHLPKFKVRVGGITTIDITKKGIDKAYGIHQIQKYLKIQIKDMLFIGDALSPGGNDYAARRTGVECIAVAGPKETKKIIRDLLEE